MNIALATQPADDLTVVAVDDHLEIHAAHHRGGHVVFLDPHEGYALAIWLEYLTGQPGVEIHDLPVEAAHDVEALYQSAHPVQAPSLVLPTSVGVSVLCTADGDYSINLWLLTVDGFEVFEYGVELAQMLVQRVLDCVLIVTLH